MPARWLSSDKDLPSESINLRACDVRKEMMNQVAMLRRRVGLQYLSAFQTCAIV